MRHISARRDGSCDANARADAIGAHLYLAQGAAVKAVRGAPRPTGRSVVSSPMDGLLVLFPGRSRTVNAAVIYEGRIKNTEIWKMRSDVRRAAEIRPESRRKRGKVTARTLHSPDVGFRSVIA